MRTIILITITIFLTGCGKPMTEDCGDNHFDVLCRTIYTENNDNRDKIDENSEQNDINANSISDLLNSRDGYITLLEFNNSVDNIYTYIDNITQGNTEIIELCSGSSENLLYINGTYIGVYKHGNKVYLTKLGDGHYVTTDGSGCRFTILNNEVYYEKI